MDRSFQDAILVSVRTKFRQAPLPSPIAHVNYCDLRLNVDERAKNPEGRMLAMGRVLPALFTLLNFYSCLATSANADDRIRIGVVAPLSGPLGLYGQSLVQGAKDAADRINASNGVLDKKIEI